MKAFQPKQPLPAGPLAIAGLAVIAAAASGAAFAGWIGQAPAIFMALVESGARWCF